MLEMIPSGDDVIAVKVSGKITGDDLTIIMDRLDAVMAAHDSVHVFVETQGVEGFEIAGLPSYMMRALPLLGKLSRFGRVAVVADQSWVRLATKIESLILPHISYRTYKPEERAEAFSWVNGTPLSQAE